MHTHPAIALAALWLALLPGTDPLPPDRVTLKSGDVLEGRLVFEDADGLVLLRKRRHVLVEPDDVLEVDANLRNLPRGLELTDALLVQPTERLLESIERLEALRLPREARLLAWLVLSRDAGNELAHRTLEHRRRGDSWSLQFKKRWYSLAKRSELAADFGKGWELETTHYRVQTNLDLGQAVDAAIRLERLHRAFHELFRVPFELYEITTPMEVAIHADRKSYPTKGADFLGGTEFPGEFSPVTNTLFLDASDGLDVSALLYEGTRQLLDNAARVKKKAEIPDWLGYGLAPYMMVAATGARGEVELQPRREWGPGFRLHAVAPKPFSLRRVLTFEVEEFVRRRDAALIQAQAYTLVHFCLHGANERFRTEFEDYVRDLVNGETSTSRFDEVSGPTEEFERLWLEHARAHAP